jgi:hypothetical protein
MNQAIKDIGRWLVNFVYGLSEADYTWGIRGAPGYNLYVSRLIKV